VACARTGTSGGYALSEAIERHTLIVPLVAGRGYLLDNHRWLHARTAFTGPRLIHRVLGVPAPSLPTGIPVPRPR
jgi:hypothetical protein